MDSPDWSLGLDRPLVLMPQPAPAWVVDAIQSEVGLIKLWDAEDTEARLAETASAIRIIAVAGHDVKVTAELMGRLPRLELVANFGVGYDHIDAAWAGQNGVIVTHTPGVLDDEVADTALGLILAAIRQFPAAEKFLRAGAWPRSRFPLSASLRARTLGIVGLGRIGKAIALRGRAFGLTVVYHNRRPLPDVPYLYYPSLIGLAEACDILVVATPGGGETRHLIDAVVLEALGPRGVFINVARGSVVDEEALITALRDGTIMTAGLDVFADEPNVSQALIDMDHVVLLPHIGSASQHTRDAMWQLMVDNVLAWSRGTGALTPVPETPWPRRLG